MATTGNQDSKPPQANPRILVVDDDEAIRKLLERILEAAGYRVSSAANGEEALKLLESERFQAMITDLIMPEQEGIETIRTAKQLYPHLKIIAISGAFGGQFLRVAELLGASATVRKPFGVKEILQAVQQALGYQKPTESCP